MLRQDYIGRLIQQLAEFLARIARLAADNRAADAEAEIREAERALGIPIGVDRLDARSLAMLVGGADKAVLAALLIEQKALLAEARGDSDGAARHRRRALDVLAHTTPGELSTQAAELGERLRAR